MRRFVSLATLLVASAMLAGCPIYPVDSCYSSYDCPNGYTCDSYLGQCVAEPGGDDDDAPSKPPPTPTPPDRNDECSTPADCEQGETCGEKGFCLPGDCTFWGCIAGYSCLETPEGKAFTCVEDGTGSGGQGGAGGGSGATCSNNLQTPPGSGTLFLADSGLGEKLSFCLAGLQSDPSISSLQTGGQLTFGDQATAENRQVAELLITGQIASSENILCNADLTNEDVLSASCWMTAGDTSIRQLGYETIGDRPFTIHVETWTDQAFVGSATGVPLFRTLAFSGRPDTETTEITADFNIEVRSTVLENNTGDDGGGRPPAP